MSEELKDRDVVFLMVNGVDAPEKVAEYLKAGRFTMPVAFRTAEDNPMKTYCVQYCPTQYVIGRDGAIVWRAVGATRFAIRRELERALGGGR